jgi:hypothetical protein
MIILTNEEPLEPIEVSAPDPSPSPKQRRLEHLRAWRDANREHLREYQRKWRADHPDRVRIHREHEYERRWKERRRLRLRREAQRRRRAVNRAEAMRRYQPSIAGRPSRPSAASAQLQEASKAIERTGSCLANGHVGMLLNAKKRNARI